MDDIRGVCLRLLVHLAVRCGPGEVVLAAVAKKVEADSFEQHADVDAISELEVHLSSIITSLDAKAVNSTDFVTEGWTALISRSSLSRQTLLRILQRRHEIGDWPFPKLTETELQMRDRLQKVRKPLVHVDPERREQLTGQSEGDEAVDSPRSTADLPPDRDMEAPASPDTHEEAQEQSAASP
ncbi:hypothetical protein BBJ28_00014251 [Nothophytophthora sp. Chile5]|nr:hypothetical protein BBJ28_00014251 [Nothophytophthora sp. Chile5]